MYCAYRRLRDDGPVAAIPPGRAWAVLGHAAAETVLRAHETFAQVDSQAADEPVGNARVDVLAGADPPTHNRQRRLVAPPWTRERVEAYAPVVRDFAARLLTARRDTLDVVADYGAPLALGTLGRFLGVAAAELPRLGALVDASAASLRRSLAPSQVAEQARIDAELDRLLGRLVAAHRERAADDALGAMVAARDAEGASLNDAELVAIAGQILVAGTGPVRALIGSALLAILADAELRDRLAGDPALIPRVVEEVLRHEAPVQRVVRVARESTRLDGVDVAAGDSVLVVLGAANRDPAAYPHADDFDPARRPTARHLAFGRGIHACLGAHLARMEARVAIETLLAAFPRTRLADAAIRWRAHAFWRELDALPVRLEG